MQDAFWVLSRPGRRYDPPHREDRPSADEILGLLAHHPAMAAGWFAFNRHVLFDTTLSERHKELVVMRGAVVRGIAYEVDQHRMLAEEAGVTAAELEALRVGPDDPVWAPLDALVLRAVDELVGRGGITDPTWDALAAELPVEQILDLIMLVGAYGALALMYRTFGIGGLSAEPAV